MKRLTHTLEWLLRHAVVYPFFRLLFRNAYSDEPIDLHKVNKVLILRFDRIGDMIVTTPIFKALKKRNPRLKIGVFTSQANAEIIKNSAAVDAIYVLDRNWWRLWQEIFRARGERYNVVLNFIFNRTTSAGVLANFSAPKAFKVGQGAEKYRFYFNRLLRLERTEQHMIEVLAYFIEQTFGFTLQKDELKFEIATDKQAKVDVDFFLTSNELARRTDGKTQNKQYVVCNISATDSVRQITSEQVLALVKHLTSEGSQSIVLIGAPAERGRLEQIHRQTNSAHCYIYPKQGNASLLQLASLIEGAVCVFTPDTSIIHFASATQTPVMGFFTQLQMAHEWVPYNVHHMAIYAPPDKPASEIPIAEITRHADSFLATLS